MKILAASVELPGQHFLHAGYMSAYPRTFGEYGYDHLMFTDAIPVNVASALTLSDSSGHAASSREAVRMQPARIAEQGWLFPYLVIILLALLLPVYYRTRRAATAEKRIRLDRGVFLLMIVMAVVLMGVLFRNDSVVTELRPSPWADSVRMAYADPEAATRVLLYGMIADGIANTRARVYSLAQVREEIALPVASLSAGEAYALDHYGLDGWGREFRLFHLMLTTVVTSDGADGKPGTADDFVLRLAPVDPDNWEKGRHAIFVRRHEGNYLMLFHRWPGGMFEYANKELARRLTNTAVFDCRDVGTQRWETDGPASLQGLTPAEYLDRVFAKTRGTAAAEQVVLFYRKSLEQRGPVGD